jgi:CRISPR/Cas system-associated protein Csx1
MRYLILTYYTKPSGQIDEVMTIAKRLKTRDWQTSNVILDFKDQRVLVCSVAGLTANKDWDTIVSYYYKYYSATVERLFEENGHTLAEPQSKIEPTPG